MWREKRNKLSFQGLGVHQGSISLSVQTPVFTLRLRVNNHPEQSWHKRVKGHHGELLCLLLELSGNFFKNDGRNAGECLSWRPRRPCFGVGGLRARPHLWMFSGNSAELTPQMINEICRWWVRHYLTYCYLYKVSRQFSHLLKCVSWHFINHSKLTRKLAGRR